MEEPVREKILELNLNKSCGADEVHPRLNILPIIN